MIEFETVDVFAETAYAGNPLAVVFGGDGLSTAEMQNIAAEFNLSETTFVLPPPRPEVTAAVRIFTPKFEMPFAGHPNVGTAFLVARRGEAFGRAIGDGVVFAEQAGDVPIAILRDGDAVTGAELAAPQVFTRGAAFTPAVIAECCGLAVGDLVVANHVPQVGSCGMPFVFAEVATRAALRQAGGVAAAIATYVPLDVAGGVYLYTRDADAGADIEARMFAPLHGVAEDPATGSATVALAALLGLLAGEDAETRLTVRQGADMGRPGLMRTRALTHGGAPQAAWIGGPCVAMMRGSLTRA